MLGLRIWGFRVEDLWDEGLGFEGYGLRVLGLRIWVFRAEDLWDEG